MKVVEGLRGGKGPAGSAPYTETAEELTRTWKSVRAGQCWQPHSSVGYHQHVGEIRSPTISYPDTALLSTMTEAGFRWARTMPASSSADRATEWKMTPDEELVMMALVYNE